MNFDKSKHLQLSTVGSTNDYLLQRAAYTSHGTVVSTFNQPQGKGTHGTSWVSETNKNLSFSLFLRPNCTINRVFTLSKVVSTAMHRVLQRNGFDAYIKWPNDLIVNDQKVGGILIESRYTSNRIKYSVVGVGLNVLQTDFTYLPHASSLVNESSKTFNLNDLQADCLREISDQYTLFEQADYNYFDRYFLQYLYRKDLESLFHINGTIQSGIIRDVTDDGLLRIEIAKGLIDFRWKTIDMIY